VAHELIDANRAKATNDLTRDFFIGLLFLSKSKIKIIYALTVKVDPVISTVNFVSPFVAGPCTKPPLELKVEPWAAHKKEEVELLYSTVAPA
jgi:hypothetical protein